MFWVFYITSKVCYRNRCWVMIYNLLQSDCLICTTLEEQLKLWNAMMVNLHAWWRSKYEGRDVLEPIPIQKPRFCTVDSKEKHFMYNALASDGLLIINLQGECSFIDIEIVYWDCCVAISTINKSLGRLSL